jgi:hypothetical protein
MGWVDFVNGESLKQHSVSIFLLRALSCFIYFKHWNSEVILFIEDFPVQCNCQHALKATKPYKTMKNKTTIMKFPVESLPPVFSFELDHFWIQELLVGHCLV